MLRHRVPSIVLVVAAGDDGDVHYVHGGAVRAHGRVSTAARAVTDGTAFQCVYETRFAWTGIVP